MAGIFDVSDAEAATPELAQERANSLKEQFIFDGQATHFLRDDTQPGRPLSPCARPSETPDGIPQMKGRKQTIEDLKYNNYYKEVFLDMIPRSH